MELKIPVKVEYTNVVVEMCRNHPTCEGCPFQKKHKGCYFRGEIPREWEFPKEFESEQAIPLSKVKWAREEIDKLDTKIAIRDTPQGRESYFIVEQAEVLKILDKLIEEIEG